MGYVYNQAKDEEGQFALGQTIDWTKFIDRYIDYLTDKERKAKHLYDVKNSLTHAAEDFMAHGITKPAGVNQHNAKEHLRSYKSTGVADISVKHRKVKLCALFRWAWRVELYRIDKLEKLETPSIRDAVRHKPPTLDQVNLIITQIKKDWDPDHAPGSRFKSPSAREFFRIRDIACVIGIGETGARSGEWFNVLRSDLDLKSRTILWRETKNGSDRPNFLTMGYIGGPLKQWLEIRNEIETGNDYLWITERGTKIDPSSWGKQFNRYVQHAGIERRIRRHDLRHLSSSAHDEIDWEASKTLHGHSSNQVHEVYDHTSAKAELELQTAHDRANPMGPILEALEQAAKPQPPQKERRVYTKIQ